MKSLIQWTLALAASAMVLPGNGTASAQVYAGSYLGGGGEQHTVLTIQADGGCRLTSETVESRTLAEQQLRMQERFQQGAEDAEDMAPPESLPDAGSAATNEAVKVKPFTDEELVKKLTGQMNEDDGDNADDSGQKFKIEAKKDTVVITATRSFSSLEELLKENGSIFDAGGVYFENVRFETDTNGLLRLTLLPRNGMERYQKNILSALKLSGARSELKLVFPGPVVASGFTAMATNATWLAVDGKKNETLDAMMKLYAAPTVITAEAGGLKLAQPLESKKLRRSSPRRAAADGDLPVTDAGPGFVAEAQSITTTTLHVFPGGENYFKQSRGFGTQTGAVVNAKLFAPKGRTLQSVSDVRVLTAVDDQGRSVAVEPEADENTSTVEYSGGSSEAATAMQIQLHLKLPPPDAQVIEAISAEAVATTAGTWKEMTLTNLQESAMNLQGNATNEIDLAAVLPGAKLTITKFSLKNNQVQIAARLQGPRTVRHLDLRAQIPGNDNFSSNLSERSSRTKDGETTRMVNLQGFAFGGEGASPATVVLTVRYPEDLRRERVKIELKGLDLL
jgi:hypothetical protein